MATIFSGVMLGVMAEIAMDLVGIITTASAGTDFVSMLLTGKSSEGIMQTVTQQLGVGLILSTLLITVPPMAGMWFNGMMGQFNAYSPLSDRWNANAPVPPHVDGGKSYQQQVEQRVASKVEQLDRDYGASQTTNTINNPFIYKNSTDTAPNGQLSDSMKSQSQLGQAASASINDSKHVINTDKAKNNKGEKA